MTLNSFTYKIIKNPFLLLLFKIFIVGLIVYFNTIYSLCMENILELNDSQITDFFYNRIREPQIDLSHYEINDEKFRISIGDIERLNNLVRENYHKRFSSNISPLTTEEIFALKKPQLSNPNMLNEQHIFRKDSDSTVSIFEIIQKRIPKLNRGAIIKEYLDENDHRRQFKKVLRQLLYEEEKFFVKEVAKNLFQLKNIPKSILHQIEN